MDHRTVGDVVALPPTPAGPELVSARCDPSVTSFRFVRLIDSVS